MLVRGRDVSWLLDEALPDSWLPNADRLDGTECPAHRAASLYLQHTNSRAGCTIAAAAAWSIHLTQDKGACAVSVDATSEQV